MKRTILITLFALCVAPLTLQAQPLQQARLTAAVAHAAAANDDYWSAPDAYGTPLIIKLARQGNVSALQSLTQYPLSGKFLLATDPYGSNILHVAKNADTVQALALLLRHFYGPHAAQKITRLANATNKLGERPLNAQINAAHADTFRLIYAYTSLKQKNDSARNRLSRLRGTNEAIFVQNKAIYCADIQAESSANGITLLQAAQAQAAYHPHMGAFAHKLAGLIPCLAD